MLKFITGNKNKFKEVSVGLAPLRIEQLNIDLLEIQELDRKKIIEHKIKEAFKHHKGEFLVEDASFYLQAFNYKFPGPFVKWFQQAVTNNDIVALVNKTQKLGVKYVVVIGYAKSPSQIKFFEGVVEGSIVKKKGKGGFGFDPIVIPKGSKKTLAQMKEVGDYSLSARGKALVKLKKYLKTRNQN
ncbi:MAG: hypothetical protein JNN11_02065 [Candidatus Doudnabacteria bacterium]|nr:hypothetical protein [Candidatus Doudnabacteria bacterium]